MGSAIRNFMRLSSGLLRVSSAARRPARSQLPQVLDRLPASPTTRGGSNSHATAGDEWDCRCIMELRPSEHARPAWLHQCQPVAACRCPTPVHRARSQNCVDRAVPGNRPCGLQAAGLPCPDPNLQTNRPGSTAPPKPPQARPSLRPCTDREKHRATRDSEDGFAVEPATLASARSPARFPTPTPGTGVVSTLRRDICSR